jgi:L-asparaginase
MTKNQHSQPNLSILVLGTGGTIAGLGGDAYTAAQMTIDGLIPSNNHHVVCEQIAQIDSKDMSFAVWERLYLRLSDAMQDSAIDAVVMTHGTDTMEETAYFLHATLACTKPVILTGAMRPADSEESDGPRNLSHALDTASTLAACVWIVFAEQVFPACGVQKNHPQRLDSFGLREPSTTQPVPSTCFSLRLPVQRWPRVEIVMNYAGASGEIVDALLTQACDGIVVAATGNGTLSTSLEAALHKAAKAGVAVRLSTRCSQGSVIPNVHHAFKTSPLSPVQARVDLMLSLMCGPDQ